MMGERPHALGCKQIKKSLNYKRKGKNWLLCIGVH